MTTNQTTEAAASPRASVAQGATSGPAASGHQQQLEWASINKRLWAENVYLRQQVKAMGVKVRNLRRLLKTKGRHA